jgi:hypothetical protein
LKNIDVKYIYDYLTNVINTLKTNIYGKYLIDNNKIKQEFFSFNNNINLKNIYNIAKILSHNDNFILLGTNFNNLKTESKINFFDNFFNLTLNLRGNIRYQEGDLSNYNTIILNIINEWNNINNTIIWDYLSFNGLLSEFKVMLELTDNNLLPKKTIEKRKRIKERVLKYLKQNKDILEANYYLTNDTYTNLNKNLKRINKKEYYESLGSDLSHYTFYGNDYISQLNIFNHYINNQIIYVTGGTGTGKSTQVPKLLMYMLKMYDYKNNGKTICTQPRISPTEGNAKRVSTELGVSININNVKTDEYYLQYKHQKDQHTKEHCSHLTLRFVTDGTLLEEVINNPFIKEKVKKPSRQFKDDYIYGFNNNYDLIIVDEAHEHNTNMDLILSLMKYSCFLNNSIRLIIISATMDDDEPIYRSYFKNINDNIVYPIKQKIYDNIFDDFKYIESIYLDRRLDISIPGQTTQFTIDEIYTDDFKITKNHKNDSIKAQEKSYEYILDICKNNDKGEILLFSTGKAEIKKAVNYLNQKLSPYDIALPFYSEMHSKYREIIEKIGDKIGTIRNRKQNIAEEWGSEYKEVKDVNIDSYKRAIIVATNVAEASITIETLKFVVDIGYEKVSKYMDDLMTNIIEVEPISEASRLQRKGRVGRTSAGTVYYVYPKGAREDIKPKYKITNDDFHNSFIKLLKSTTKDTIYNNFKVEKDIIIPEFSPYFPEAFSLINKTITINDYKETYFMEKNIYKIYEKQYGNEGDYNLYEYFNQNIFNIVNDINDEFIFNDNFIRYESGYTDNQLIDEYGHFYIIHPFENKIKRNILNKIISYDNTKKDKIDRNIFSNIIKNMEYKLLYLNKSKKRDILDGNKTIYSKKILEVMRIIPNITESNSIILLLGFGYNIQTEIIEIVSMLDTINGSILSLASFSKKNKKIQEYDKFKKRFSEKSDIISIYNITKLIRGFLSNCNIYKLLNAWNKGENIFNIFRKQYDDLIIEFNNNFKKFSIKKLIQSNKLEDYNILNFLKYNGLMYSDRGFKFWLSKSKILMKYLNVFNKDTLKSICDKNYLNYNIIEKYINTLINYIKNIISSDRDLMKEFGEISPFEWVKNIRPSLELSLIDNNINNKILNIILFSSPLNIGVKLNNKYKSINNYNDIDFLKIFDKNNTTNYGITSFFHYNYVKLDNNINVGIITNINPIILGYLFPFVYNRINIKDIYTIYTNGKYDNITIDNENWEYFINKIVNNSTYNYFPLGYSKKYLPIISDYIDFKN